jgi:hypothetical protein
LSASLNERAVRRSRKRGLNCGLLAFAAPGHRRADVIIVVSDLAVQAIEALIHVDLAALLDRTDWTDTFAVMTRVATFRMAAQPVEHADAAEDGKASPKRASEAAIETLDE